MAKRRNNGEGSVSKRTDGRYMGKITVGRNLNGKLIRKAIYGRTMAEVVEKMSKVRYEVQDGIFYEPSKMTLEQWLHSWYETYKKKYLREQTQELYMTIIKKLIVPRIGQMKIKEIKPMHMQELINQLKGNNYATSTLYKVKNIINPAFKVAAINKLIKENPFQNVQMPSNEEKEVKALSREEQFKFEESAKECYFYEVFITALDTGLRSGELLALFWEDVDFKRSELNVKRTLIEITDEKTGKKHLKIQDKTKTLTSERTVPLTPRVVELLKSIKRKCKAIKNRDNKIVFCSKVGTYISPRNLRRSMHNVCKKANIPVCSMHALRHTFTTRLYEEKIPIKEIAGLLGHSKVDITQNRYTHIFEGGKVNAIKALANIKLLSEEDNKED